MMMLGIQLHVGHDQVRVQGGRTDALTPLLSTQSRVPALPIGPLWQQCAWLVLKDAHNKYYIHIHTHIHPCRCTHTYIDWRELELGCGSADAMPIASVMPWHIFYVYDKLCWRAIMAETIDTHASECLELERTKCELGEHNVFSLYPVAISRAELKWPWLRLSICPVSVSLAVSVCLFVCARTGYLLVGHSRVAPCIFIILLHFISYSICSYECTPTMTNAFSFRFSFFTTANRKAEGKEWRRRWSL